LSREKLFLDLLARLQSKQSKQEPENLKNYQFLFLLPDAIRGVEDDTFCDKQFFGEIAKQRDWCICKF